METKLNVDLPDSLHFHSVPCGCQESLPNDCFINEVWTTVVRWHWKVPTYRMNCVSSKASVHHFENIKSCQLAVSGDLMHEECTYMSPTLGFCLYDISTAAVNFGCWIGWWCCRWTLLNRQTKAPSQLCPFLLLLDLILLSMRKLVLYDCFTSLTWILFVADSICKFFAEMFIKTPWAVSPFRSSPVCTIFSITKGGNSICMCCRYTTKYYWLPDPHVVVENQANS